MSFEYGDEVTRMCGTAVFVGKFIGLAKRLSGEMHGIAETAHGIVFMGPLNTFKHFTPEAPKEGQVIIRNREHEPGKVLPPLKSSKY